MARSSNKFDKPNATGRNEKLNQKFVQLPDSILSSPAYRSLTPNARALLVELISLYNGYNNGALWLSVDDAAARIGRSDHHVASAAFDELIEVGLIAVVNLAYYSIKTGIGSRARTFRLTWLYDQKNQKPATNDWKSFNPEHGSSAAKRMNRGLKTLAKHRKQRSQNEKSVVESTTLESYSRPVESILVVESTTEKAVNGTKPLFFDAVDSTAHIDITMAVGAVPHPACHWWGSGAVTNAGGTWLVFLCHQLIWLCEGTTSLECAA